MGADNLLKAIDNTITVAQNSVDNIISILLDTKSEVASFWTDGSNVAHPISLSGSYTNLGGSLKLEGNTIKYTPEVGF